MEGLGYFSRWFIRDCIYSDYFWSMRKITIAIDGYSSTGKSTIAKQLAKAALQAALFNDGPMAGGGGVFGFQ